MVREEIENCTVDYSEGVLTVTFDYNEEANRPISFDIQAPQPSFFDKIVKMYKEYKSWPEDEENKYARNLAKQFLEIQGIDSSHPEYIQRLQEETERYKQDRDMIMGLSGGIKVMQGVTSLENISKGLSNAGNGTTTSNDSQITINADLLFLANGLRPGKLLKLNSNNSGMPYPDDLDPSFDWKLVLGGKDGTNVSDETFLYYYKQAIKDFAMKDVIPGGITIAQKMFGVAASVVDVPIWSNSPIPKSVIGLNYAVQFPGEILKNLSTHYDDINYTWEHAVTDAFKTKGIETVADMTAESLGKYIAKIYNMDQYSKWLLTKGLNMVFEEYGKKKVEKL